MKKVLALSLLVLLAAPMYVEARTQYDATGRHIVKDGTIRGQKRARAERVDGQAAAAAKVDYSDNGYSDDIRQNATNPEAIKTNYYQARGRQTSAK